MFSTRVQVFCSSPQSHAATWYCALNSRVFQTVFHTTTTHGIRRTRALHKGLKITHLPLVVDVADLQVFRMFHRHSEWFIAPINSNRIIDLMQCFQTRQNTLDFNYALKRFFIDINLAIFKSGIQGAESVLTLLLPRSES